MMDCGVVAPLDWTQVLVRRNFKYPGADRWADHFRLDGLTIAPLTGIGEVTERILGFNRADRRLERQTLKDAGRYPTQAALRRIGQVAS